MSCRADIAIVMSVIKGIIASFQVAAQPTWKDHMTRNLVFDGDNVFLHGAVSACKPCHSPCRSLQSTGEGSNPAAASTLQ